MHELIVLIAAILGVGILCQLIAWRLNIPAILPLLAAGLIAGPVLNLFNPRELLGDLFTPIVSLSVAVILFEGALTLQWEEIQHATRTVRNLITVGALITLVGGTLAAYFIVGVGWDIAVLFGALIVVTGPTVIQPLLRMVRPVQRVATILKWEGILIDPLGALIAVLVFDFLVAEGSARQLGLQTVVGFLQITLIGLAAGLAGGWIVTMLLRRYLVPDYLRDVFVLAMVALVFGVADILAAESGLLAVTVMGLWVGNRHLPGLEEVLNFKENLTILLVSILFILLAASIDSAVIASLDWRALVLLLVVMFVLRPLSVFVSAAQSSLTLNEKLFLAYISPRGIVAASVSSVFSLRLAERGFEEAPLLVALVFLVIVGTVLLQGSTARPVARLLGVAEADPQGFLIMGATPFGRDLACNLAEAGFVVRLVDTNYQNVSQARMMDLDVFYGDILAERIQDDLDLSGIGRLLALTSNLEANALACSQFKSQFGSQEVYQLPPRSLGDPAYRAPSTRALGRLLFSPEATFQHLEQMLEDGGRIRRTLLTEQFNLADHLAEHGDQAVPLILIRGRQVRVFTVDGPPIPVTAGWTLVSLVPGKSAAPSTDSTSTAGYE